MGRKAPGSSLTCRGRLGTPPSGREMSPRQAARTTARGRPPASRRARSRLAQATSLPRLAARGKPDDALGASSSAGAEIIDLVDSDTDAETRGSATAKRQRAAAPADKPAGDSGTSDAGATESSAKKRRLRVPKILGNPVA